MRRVLSLAAGALAFLAMTGLAWAQTDATTTTTLKATTTSAAPMTIDPHPTSTTTAAPAKTTTTTAKAGTGKPIPPPASGPSQPLDPTLLGGTIIPVDTSTTLFGVESVTVPPAPTTSADVSALRVTTKSAGASGPTLGLAAVAWLASLGGLLVYAEDQRGKRWRHLAR